MSNLTKDLFKKENIVIGKRMFNLEYTLSDCLYYGTLFNSRFVFADIDEVFTKYIYEANEQLGQHYITHSISLFVSDINHTRMALTYEAVYGTERYSIDITNLLLTTFHLNYNQIMEHTFDNIKCEFLSSFVNLVEDNPVIKNFKGKIIHEYESERFYHNESNSYNWYKY